MIRKVIDDLKKRNSVSGRTIQIADKGLNCAENIFHTLKDGDGYIFSKSVKQLPEIERTWVLLSNDYRDIKDDNGDVLYRIKECVDEFEYKFKVLKNNYYSEDLFEFVRDFRVAKISERKYINLSRGTVFIKNFASRCNLPLMSYFLSDGEIKKMLSHRF